MKIGWGFPKISLLFLFYCSRFILHQTGRPSGYLRTHKKLVTSSLYWKGMTNTIIDFMRSCDTCQRTKYMTTLPSGLLQPLPTPTQVWEDISMNFIPNPK